MPVLRLIALAALPALGLIEALAVYAWNPNPRVQLLQLAYGGATAFLLLILARTRRTFAVNAPPWIAVALLATAFVASVAIAQFALETYPVSGDEYGYNFLADTLMHGRLWNSAYPAALKDVLETNYIGGHGDQRLSQYPPGWPVLLIPFKLIGIPQFATAVFGLGAGWFLLSILRCIPTAPSVRLGLFACAVVAPFTVFNNASYFNHTLTACALLAIIDFQMRDEARPSLLLRMGIGLAFSLLLTSRYETFAVCAALFVADALYRYRMRSIRWIVPIALGAAPVTLAFLLYNWRITNSPFVTTTQWIMTNLGYGLNATGMDGPHSAGRAFSHLLFWFGKWQDFAPVLFLPLYFVALWYRLRNHTLRWYDLLFPAVVTLFFFFPDNGGMQYGPRYWYIAFVAMPVTIAAAVPAPDGIWRFGRLRFDPLRLAVAQGLIFAGFVVGYAAFLYVQTESRLTPPRLAAIAPPNSVVLIQSIGRRYGPWQGYAYQQFPKDYTRNGLGELGPVVIALDLGEKRTELLCHQLPGRAIYSMQLDRMGPGGSLQGVCNLPPAAPGIVRLSRKDD